MKKKIVTLIILGAAAILLFAQVGTAGETRAEDEILNELYQEMIELREEIIDRRVELGEIEPEQGDWMKERLKDWEEWDNEDREGPRRRGYHMGGMMGPGGFHCH